MRLEIDLALLGLAGDDNGEVLADLDIRYFLENISDEGQRYGFVIAGRAERDSGRIGWGGQVGLCPSGLADCPQTPLRGYTSGLQAETAGERDNGVRSALTEAFFFLHTGWGEWRVGYGDGAARHDATGGPAAFRTVRADGGRLDPTGLNAARTQNYASGQAPKLLFRSIPLGQISTIGTFRASASITPEVRDCGVDYCAFGTGPGLVRSAKPSWIAEFGGLYEVQRGEQEWAVSIGWAQSLDEEGNPAFDRLSTYDAGLSWQRGNWLAGARWLRSDNAVAGDGDYEALSASMGYENGPWMTTLEWASFSDNLVHADGETWQVGTSWLGERWLLGAGIQHGHRQDPSLTPPGRRGEDTESTVFFAEASWRY